MFFNSILPRRALSLINRRRLITFQSFFINSAYATSREIKRPLSSKLPLFKPARNKTEQCIATYIWIDGTKVKLRAKSQVLAEEPQSVSDLRTWHFDGSSTYQAKPGDSDLTLKPVAMCRDPFFENRNAILVLCEVRLTDGSPAIGNNHREGCVASAEKYKDIEAWFAFEQEYVLFNRITGKPYGWPSADGGVLPPQGPYYCGVGDGRTFGREIIDEHLIACLDAGLRIGGTNAEVMPSQWEFQIGPLPPVQVADEMWLSRYILERIGEKYGATINLDPKPMAGDWNGSGNHVNFSTKYTRAEGGMKHIKEAIDKLSRVHSQHIEAYDPSGGVDNRRRLTGLHETSSIEKFSHDVGNRNVSVRIPRPVSKAGKGHIEDRRPAANCDPYLVVDRILRTICADEVN